MDLLVYLNTSWFNLEAFRQKPYQWHDHINNTNIHLVTLIQDLN